MKEKIHPKYHQTTVSCACGEVIHTRSTKENIRVEICSKCHPFFTGKQKLIDSAGRVEKFKQRYGQQPVAGSAKKQAAQEQEKAADASANETKKTLQDLDHSHAEPAGE